MQGLIYVSWILYASMEGIREGTYWHVLGLTRYKPSIEHFVWTIQRMFVFFMAVITTHSIFFSASLLLAFPFFHDGWYYAERNRHDGLYPKKFWDQSTTSTAVLTKYCTPFLRTIYFLLSILIFIYVQTI